MHIGDVIAERFELVSVVGEGGMGVVFRAQDRRDGGTVALKSLKRVGPREKLRFAREARVLQSLSHPGIVRYVADGLSDAGEPWLAMEWLEGEDLGTRLARGALSGVASWSLARGIAEALAHAHDQGLVHRDLKPSNVWLLGGAGTGAGVKLLDFGVVRRLAPYTSPAVTQSGVMLGTPGYMAPEQARGERDVDARADLYGLGCILFECLTGRAPFVGEHVVALLAKVILEEPPRVSSLVHVPGAVDALVARLLAKDREERPRDAAEVLRCLDALGRFEARDVASAPPRAPLLREQRWLSVLLVSAPSASPEDATVEDEAAAGLSVARVAADSGARLEHLVGGAQVLLWEGTGAPVELAGRAARAALLLAGTNRPPLALASGRAALDGPMPVGQALDRAAACAKDSDGEVVLDDAIAELLAERFEVWRGAGRPRLIAERVAEAGARTLLGRATPCVGREVELSVLDATLGQVLDEGSAAAVVLTGEMGVGKSRVRQEWVRGIAAKHPGVRVWRAHADAMHTRAAYGIASRLARDACGVPFDAGREETRRCILEAVVRVVAPSDRQRVASRLSELCGAPWDRDLDEALVAARQDAIVMGDQLRAAWEDFLVASCSEHAVVLVVEDLQWADAPSLALIDRALRNFGDLPWMVLALGRPEHRDLHPRLWAERGVREEALGPLKNKPAERLARAVLGDEAAETRIRQLVSKAAGNAYFLEELLRAEAEGLGDAMPDTVLAMVEARLLRLEAPLRRILRAASVYGGRFDARSVEAVLGEAPREGALAALVARDWLAALEGGGHVFRQASSREAAYAMLVEEDKRYAHERAAEHLAERGGEPVAIAEHLERAETPERAVVWWIKAAKQALESNDFRGSVARAEAAERCGAVDALLAEVLLVRAEAHSWLDENTALGAAVERLGAAATTAAQQAHALRWGMLSALRAGDARRLEETLAKARALAERVPDDDDVHFCSLRIASIAQLSGLSAAAEELASRVEAAGVPLAARGARILGAKARWQVVVAHHAHELETSLDLRREAARILRSGGDLRAAVVEESTCGFDLALIGAYHDAVSVIEASLVECSRLGLRSARAAALHNLGFALLGLGALERALEAERQAVEVFSSPGGGNPIMEAASLEYMARILVAAAQPDEAAAAAERAIGLLPPSHAFGLVARASLADALLTRRGPDDAARALEHARAAWASLRAEPASHADPSFVLRVHLDALEANGLVDEAREARDAARAWALGQAQAIRSEALRRTFLERQREVVRILERANRPQRA